MKNISSILVAVLCMMFPASQALAQMTFAKDGLRYHVLDGQNVSVCYDDEDSLFLSGRVVIPEQIINPVDEVAYKVVAVADTAFKGCDLIDVLVLPASLQHFGAHVIDHCFNMVAYEVASGSQFFKAVDGVLFSADGTTLVSCPTGKGGEYVFPKDVKNMAPAAFSTCKNFSKVELPEGLKEVPDYAFYECWGLADVKFPTTLETIGAYAFDGTILQFLDFSSKLKSIGSHAFDRSSMVECICRGSKPAQMGDDVFGNDMNYTRLYVPSNSVTRYKKSAWSIFPTIYPGTRTRRWMGSYR
jgi:hypothetical protein